MVWILHHSRASVSVVPVVGVTSHNQGELSWALIELPLLGVRCVVVYP